jgi:hypothetical protein
MQIKKVIAIGATLVALNALVLLNFNVLLVEIIPTYIEVNVGLLALQLRFQHITTIEFVRIVNGGVLLAVLLTFALYVLVDSICMKDGAIYSVLITAIQ